MLKVCITVDTEFSIAGAFAHSTWLPIAEQRVLCMVGKKSHGLGFMLDCFSRHQVKASFFVESLNRRYFKHDPMRPIAEQLHAAGHEVQLHVHPCWDVFQHADWRERARMPMSPGIDDFYGRSEDDSLRLIESAMEVFDDWKVPTPTAFRSGNLRHDDTLYKAIARAGIPYASNVGAAIYDCGDPRYQLYSGRHLRHGVVECPLLSFRDFSFAGSPKLKSLTITGSSFAETRLMLEQAYSMGIEEVVILTHPFEFVQSQGVRLHNMRPNRLNRARLEKLCAYLAANRGRFQTTGVAEAAAAPLTPDSERNLLLKGKLSTSLPRAVAQVCYDQYGKWQMARSSRSAPFIHEEAVLTD